MDNFKKHQRPKSTHKTLDGFLAPKNKNQGGSLGSSAPSNVHHSRSFPTAAPRRQVGNFGGSDGFIPRRPSQQSSVPDGTALGRRQQQLDQANTNAPDTKEKKPAKKRRLRKGSFKAAVTLLIIFLVGSGYLFGKGYLQARRVFDGKAGTAIFDDGIDPNRLHGEGDGRINILMLARGGAGHDGADLTDTIMVASIDPIQKDVGLLSIPRDLWVTTPNGNMKINAVYAMTKQAALYRGESKAKADEAGFKAIEEKVEEVAGIPINYHAIVDFAGFAEAINTVGGVTINVKEPLYDTVLASENYGNPLLFNAGTQHVNGKKALLYAQSRHSSARGDFDRTERQREVMVALKDRVFTLGTFGNPVKITQLLSAFGGHVKTNISLDDIMQLYNIGQSIDNKKVKSIGLADPPHELVTTGYIDGQSVVIPKAGLFDYSAIQSYVRNALKDGFIRKENPNILVLNGTNTPGAAKAKANVLKSYGYKVIGTGDAPTHDYTDNVFVDLTHGQKKYTKRYMELRFKTKATDKLPDGIDAKNADFVIIVGQNGTN